MSEIHLLHQKHPRGETPILVGAGALDEAASRLESWCAGRSLFVVSSDPILDLHGAALEPGWGETRRQLLPVPDGEVAKSLETAGHLWDRMLAAGGKRDSRLLAFGGGSVGDLGGFVAGAFLRGISFVQVPTTLLGQVDAAIGGKTAVDRPAAKNSVGLFHHPALVIADTRFLGTLPAGEIRSGLAEVVKMGFLLDPELFERVEGELPAMLSGDPEALVPAVAGAARAKVAVVERDPEEAGERRLLNFGHTVGHGLEAALAYEGLRHGEAVAYGMLFVLRLAERRGLPAKDAQRLREILTAFDLPPLPPVDPSAVLAALKRDKKAREGGIAWVLPAQLGRGVIADDIPIAEVEAELQAFLIDPL